MRLLVPGLLALASVAAAAAPARAQRGPIDGYVTVTGDYLPNLGDTLELRTRLFVERDIDAGPNLRFSLSGWAEGLVADRDGAVRDRANGDGANGEGVNGDGRVRDAVARPHEAYVDLRAGRLDLRAGLSTLVWGRLDELQPSDVINPLDISRFLFEGRSEARLPVPLVRARWFGGEAWNVEGVWVPLFRRGRFDYLDESSSPFSLVASTAAGGPGGLTLDRREPPRTLGSSQGGLRVSATTGRVDWSVSAYRGFESFGIVSLPLVETFPRFSMVAGDLETIRGDWAVRGEMAVFVEDSFQSPDGLGAIEGRSAEGGVSLERRAGNYRVNGALLIQHRDMDGASDTDVSLVTGAQRSFSRDTRRLFLFGVWNVADASGFLRSIGAWSLRDDLWVEGSVGWFFGDGTDTLSRFGTRDFAYIRLKAYF